jgi:hypothetical protein
LIQHVNIRAKDKVFTTRMIIWIYILNITDIIFTQLLLTTGLGYEANPLMRQLTEHPIAAILFKLSYAGIMCLILYRVSKKMSGKELWKSAALISLVLFLYIFINCMHIYHCFTMF